MAETLVTKGEFARLANISAGRVSQLIAAGKIGGAAIRGEGRAAQLVLEIALAQFRAGRDVGQALGNGAHARTVLPEQVRLAPEDVAVMDEAWRTASPAVPEAPASDAAKPARTAPSVPVADPVAERIQKERLEQERIKTERMRREEAASEGRYMLADEAVAQMNQVAATVVRVFEGGLADMANAISARFAVPQRDVMHELQKSFREVRGRASAAHRREADALPQTMEDEAGEVAGADAGA